MKISLFLTNAVRPELERIEVSDGAAKRVRLRAANIRRAGDHYSLTWSPGVRGLTTLLVIQSCSDEEAVLSGEARSLAAALDSALSKQPEWLCEMFGVDSSGRAVARRLILRENPERKRYGPVSIRFYYKIISASNISVYLNGERLTDTTSLVELRDKLIDVWDTASTSGTDKHISHSRSPRLSVPQEPQRSPPLLIQEWVEQKSFQEAYRVLSDVTSLSRSLARRKLNSLNQHWLTEGISSSSIVFPIQGLERPIRLWAVPTPENVEELRRYLADRGGLRLGISTGGVGSLAIFDTIIRRYQLPISINYQFANSQEIVEKLREQTILETVDGFNLSIVCTMKLFAARQAEFAGLSLMPHNSHGQVSRQRRTEQRRVEPALLFSTQSSSGLFLDRSQIPAAATFEDPIELQDAIQGDEGIRALLWWPFYEIFDRRGSMQREMLAPTWQFEATVLVVHRRFLESRTMVDILLALIRESWLSLLERPSSLQAVVRERCRDEGYLRHFCRTSGLISPGMMPAGVEYRFPGDE